MQKTSRKILSVLLAVIMVLSIVPTAGVVSFAATSGDWSYYVLSEDDKTCSITDYTGSATDLTIPSAIDGYTVTSIGSWTFEDCTSLESITIPDSVTSIGDYAFYECTKLTSINVDADNEYYSSDNGVLFNKDKTELIKYPEGKTDTSYVIPDSVTSIGYEAFYKCTSLTSVTIPDSVTSIGYCAFLDCTSLESVTIGDGVTSIGYMAFRGCTSLKSVTIPDSLTSIGDYAFLDCTSLESVTIPDSVTSIGSWAFENCTSLASITFPDSVTSIGNGTFSGCTSLTSVTIPDSVTSIGYSAFENCTSLESINVDADNKYYSSDNGVLFNKDKTELIQYPAGKTDTSYVIPNSVTSIGSKTFYGCTSLTSVTIPDSVTSIGNYAFEYCSKLASVTIPDSVTSIGYWAFYNCTSLESVTIPDSVTSIEWGAFYGCTSLTSVTIPDSVTSIGDEAFHGCTSLTSVTIPDSVTSIGYMAFCNCTSLTSVTIPDSVTSIDSLAFEYCTSLESVTIPDSVTSIGYEAFYNTAYYNNEDNWENGVLYIGNHLIEANTDISGSYEIKEGTLTIAVYAFEGCKSLTSATIPDSVTSIGGSVFSGCTSLERVAIGDGVTSIGSWAFENCTSLESITIPDSVTSIGRSAFYNTAYYNNSDNWENGVLYISNHLIKANTDISGSYEIKEGTLAIADEAFDDCISLKSITIPNSVTSIGESAFSGCTSLKSITIPDSVTSIGDYAFYGCKSLTSVTIPDSVTSIGSWAFNGCTSLESVTIPDSVTSIGHHAFGYYYNGDYKKIYGFTIYGYTGTEAESYANDNGFTFIALIAVTNTENGISVIFPKDDIPDENTVLNVEKLTAGENGTVYEITLTLNGEAVQPAGEVTVKIPVPDTMDGNKCKVYRQETDGAYTDMNAVYEDGYMAFTTDHFSVYVVKEAETDYTEYNKAVKQANAIDRSQYTAESLAALDSALAVDVSSASQEEIDAQTEVILNAVNALEYKSADYTEYDKAVEQANAIDRSQYTAESLAVLDSALAVDVSGKNITEQSVVDAQTEAITDALKSLVKRVAMYRLYNPNSGEHFYTSNTGERDNLVKLGWNYEGIGWYAPSKSATPVYRLYNKNGGEHHYTASVTERDRLVSLGWNYEGIGWNSDDAQGVPLYRQYNPNAFANNHNYTASKTENDRLVSYGWRYEGIGWYGVA